MQVTLEERFLILVSSLSIILLLDSLRMDLKEQRFRLWCHTRSSLLSYPLRSSIDHILAMSSLVSLACITSFSTSYKLVGFLDGLLVKFRGSYPVSRLLSSQKILILQMSPQGASLMRSSIMVNMG